MRKPTNWLRLWLREPFQCLSAPCPLPYDAQLTVSRPVRLAGVPLRAETHTLWTLPTHNGVQLIINRQNGHWGIEYRPELDIARRPMRVEVQDPPVERFTIRVDSASSSLVMEWGTFRWSALIQATR